MTQTVSLVSSSLLAQAAFVLLSAKLWSLHASLSSLVWSALKALGAKRLLKSLLLPVRPWLALPQLVWRVASLSWES